MPNESKITKDYPLPLIRDLLTRYNSKLVQEITDEYNTRHGYAPINLSHWNPSAQLERSMERTLSFNVRGDSVPYLYVSPDAVGRLTGLVGLKSSTAVITPSGTASIACVVLWLAARNVKRLTVIDPSYFTVSLLASSLGMQVTHVSLRRESNSYCLPALEDVGDAVWVTNPVYSTTHYLTAHDCVTLRSAAASGRFLVADESLAFPGHSLGETLSDLRSFVGIYSPHKAISLNGLKCSFIACAPTVEQELLEIFDVLVGGLPLSSTVAASHVASANFHDCGTVFSTYVKNAYERVSGITRHHRGVHLDAYAPTTFVSMFVPTLSAELGWDRQFLTAATEASAAIAVPAVQNGYPETMGFGFRVNLAGVDDNLLAGLHRWLSYLESSVRT